jgi:uncharacterized protein YkwD
MMSIGKGTVWAVIGLLISAAFLLPSPALAADASQPVPHANGFKINAGLNDAWINPATAGQGFLITVFPEGKSVFLAWFTYDTERPPEDVGAMLGEPGHRWLTAQGSYDGDTAVLKIFVTAGGVFDSAEPAPTTDLGGDGSITLEFADCNAGLVTYEITSLGRSGEIPIERIVTDNVPMCETLAGGPTTRTTPPEPPGLEGITSAHNAVRASVDVAPLAWDADLAAVAQAWADGCVDEDAPAGLIDHNPGRSDNYPGYVGENVYGAGGAPSAQEAVDLWASEAANYDYDSNSCAPGRVCGHYTQLVWAATERVGCGIAQCSGLTFGNTIVCNYSPGGNTGGRPY